MGGDDHRCEWRDETESLRAEVVELRAQFAKLQRQVFGKRSEKMPSVAQAIRDPARVEQERIAALQKRRENAEKKRQLVTRKIEHKVREDQKTCPRCGGHDFTRLGDGKMTELYELVPALVERQLHVQEKLRCRCGETILTADGPAKVYDKTRFGPTFMAQVAVSKCADSLPLYRQAKAYRRAGVQVGDSTLGDLFHRTAELVQPLYDRLLRLVAEKEIVQADETTERVQAKGKTRTAWLWSFIARDEAEKEMIAYVFSRSRSGETPVKVLADTIGKLLVDGYSGYNKVTLPGGRERAGCLAHLRRKFFEAQSAAPEAARRAMDFILEIYKIERAALDNDLLPSTSRCDRRPARPSWTSSSLGSTPSRAGTRRAGRWARPSATPSAQWDALTLFLTDPHLPIDNNASERALRVAALGRKNFLFVGTDEAGENLAGLYSLIATCEANGVNPVEYLADVLIRVQTHPASRIDELLPHHWTRRPEPSA